MPGPSAPNSICRNRPALDKGRSHGQTLQSATGLSLLSCLVLAILALLLRLPVLILGDFNTYAAAVHRALNGEAIYTAVQLAGPYHLPDISQGRGVAYPPTAILLLLRAALGSTKAILYILLAIASVIPAPDVFPNYLLVVVVATLPLACRVASRVLTSVAQ